MRMLIAVLVLAVPLFAQSSDIVGRVVDPSGGASPRATVHVYQAWPRVGVNTVCPSCYRDCGKQATTGPDGVFRVAEVDDDLVFRVLAVAEGYQPAFASKVDPRNGAVTIAMKKRVTEGILVRGRVIDPDGKLVVGATVTPQAVRQKGRTGYGNIPGVEPLSITNERGEFALRVPPETSLDVRVRARNFAPRIEEKIVPGELRTIQLGLGTTVTGRLVKDGKPLAGVPVGFVQKWRASATWMGPDEIGTDEEGRFVMTALPPGFEYVVHPKNEELTPFAAQAKVVCTATEGASIDAGTFVVKRGRTLRGRVAGGRAGMEIVLSSEYTLGTRVAHTDAEGRFVFEGVPEEPVNISGDETTEARFTPDRDMEIELRPQVRRR